MVNLLYRAWTKGTAGEVGPPRYSVNWALARRAWFECYSDRVTCGDWVIRSADVRDAVLYESRQWFIPVFVLAIATNDCTYQFGFNPWAKIAAHLPFAFRREKVRLGYSRFSIAARGMLLIYIVLMVWYCQSRT